MKTTIEARAAAKGMSLGELRQFVARLDGAPEDTALKATVTIGASLLRTIKAETG